MAARALDGRHDGHRTLRRRWHSTAQSVGEWRSSLKISIYDTLYLWCVATCRTGNRRNRESLANWTTAGHEGPRRWCTQL